MGINDLKTIPLFPEKKTQIIQQCRQNWQQLLDLCAQQGKQVIVTTVFPSHDIPIYRRWMWSAEIDEAVAEINAFLLTRQDSLVQVLDTYSLLLDESGKVREEYFRDELHLNRKGYEALNTSLIPLLKKQSYRSALP